MRAHTKTSGGAAMTPSHPLLLTKLSIPPARPGLVTRARLLVRLVQEHPRLTLLCAPPGFGKSTLLCDWLQTAHYSASARVTWLTLDEADNDPLRFWTYLVAAVQRLHPQVGATLLQGLEAPHPPLEALLTSLLNDLTSFTEQMILVLEDYQVIQAPPIHQAMAYLLEHLPPTVQLVVATRSDPPFPLARLRARGELGELREADLRFTLEEANVFFQQTMGLTLAPEALALLTDRTEGWIAGLQLAALSLQHQQDVQAFVAAFRGSHAYVADYLTEEVLAQQPGPIQAFLLKTSILTRLNGALASAVIGDQDGRALLEQVRQANLFLTPLDQERHWYRYHQLFADLLRVRLEETFPDLVPELYRRASAWCQQLRLGEEAIQYALAGGLVEEAAELIERRIPAMGSYQEMAAIWRWVRALPDQVVHHHPRVCMMAAWSVLLSGQSERLPSYLESVLRAVESSLQEAFKRELLGHVTALQAIQARYRGDHAGAIALSLRALDALADGYAFTRNVLYMNLGATYLLSGALDEARHTFDQALQMAHVGGQHALRLAIRCNQARLLVAQGHLRQAAATFQQVLQASTPGRGRGLPEEASAYIGLGEIDREGNRLEQAEANLMRGIEVAQLIGEGSVLATGSIALARLKYAQGEPDQAFAVLQQAEQRWRFLPPAPAHLVACRVRFWIAQRAVTQATAWAETCGLSAQDQPSFQREWEYLTLVRLLLVQHRADEAMPLLKRLQDLAETGKRLGSVIEILMLRALIYQALGQTQQARFQLIQALQLAEAEGYVRLFLDEGAALVALLRQVAAEPIAPGYLQTLLALVPDTVGAPSVPGAAHLEVLLEPLSEREREVLRLVAAGHSNQEAATSLSITAGAVKKHLSNIYSKLGVSSRTQALARARELSLL